MEKLSSNTKEILSWILTFALAIGAAFLIKNYLIINADVPTGSMENTIMPGDRLIGNRLAYKNDSPERGDVVIFHYPDDEEELYVKRVIGTLPLFSTDRASFSFSAISGIRKRRGCFKKQL